MVVTGIENLTLRGYRKGGHEKFSPERYSDVPESFAEKQIINREKTTTIVKKKT